MKLVLDIAVTHVLARVRQTLVGMLGVAMGVGFSVMMAALMEGSQRDFVTQLVDSLPHVTINDERRNPPRQPAEDAYAAVQFSGLRTPVTRPGIRNPYRYHGVGRDLARRRGRPVRRVARRNPLRWPRYRGKCHRHRSSARGARFEAREPDPPGLPRQPLQVLERRHPRRQAGRKDRRPRRQHHRAGLRHRTNSLLHGGRPAAHGHQPDRRDPGLHSDQDRPDPRRADRRS